MDNKEPTNNHKLNPRSMAEDERKPLFLSTPLQTSVMSYLLRVMQLFLTAVTTLVLILARKIKYGTSIGFANTLGALIFIGVSTGVIVVCTISANVYMDRRLAVNPKYKEPYGLRHIVRVAGLVGTGLWFAAFGLIRYSDSQCFSGPSFLTIKCSLWFLGFIFCILTATLWAIISLFDVSGWIRALYRRMRGL